MLHILYIYLNSFCSHEVRALPHPLPLIPLPHQPRITPFADFHLRLPRPIHRLPRPADVAPAEFDLRPCKRPVVEHPRERLHLSGPLSLLQTVVAEVLPPAAPSHRRRRPPTADVAGLVLSDREGDVVRGVDRGRRMTAEFSTLTAGAVIERCDN